MGKRALVVLAVGLYATVFALTETGSQPLAAAADALERLVGPPICLSCAVENASMSATSRLELDGAGADVGAPCRPLEPADITYWATRDGHLVAPSSDPGRLRTGDTVDVELRVPPGCTRQVTVSSYERGVMQRQRISRASVDTKTLGAGVHVLQAGIPGCRFLFEVHTGPPLADHLLPTGGNPYGAGLIVSAVGGARRCVENE